jgi:Tfp pilus assembly protein PilZ
MTRDHRHHRRVEFERRAWCEHQQLTLYLPVSNVSRSGMFLQTTTPFRTGDTLRVSFESSDGSERIVAQVEIVWACRAGRSSGVGCRVTHFFQGEDAYGRMVDELKRAKSA